MSAAATVVAAVVLNRRRNVWMNRKTTSLKRYSDI